MNYSLLPSPYESNVISPRKDILDDIVESLEQMCIHGQDSKGKGEGSNEDPLVEAKTNYELPEIGKLLEIIPLIYAII